MLTPTEILCRLIAIPSVNPMGRNLSGPEFFETRLTDWLVSWFRSIGADVETIELAPGRSNLLARYQGCQNAPTLLIDAHQDTVPVEGMTVPPFEPIVSDGRVTGRGACDVKGSMAAMLWAFHRLFAEKPADSANVIFSCSCDEEFGTLGITDLVRYWTEHPSKSRLITGPPDGAIVAEPSELNVIVAHRGVVRFRIRTGGVACHSSEPSRGTNAIYRMGRVLSCLEAYATGHLQELACHRLCGSPTLSVGRIGGGTSVNIVPDDCWIEVDRRLVPGEDSDKAVASIERFLRQQLDFDFKIEPPFLTSPPLTDDNNRWLAQALAEQATAVKRPPEFIGVPFGTHASRLSASGVPAVVYGPGSIEQAHTNDEYIEIEQLKVAPEVYYRMLSKPPSRATGNS